MSLPSSSKESNQTPYALSREGGRSMGISERMGDVLGLAVQAKLLREVLEHPLQVNHLAIIMDCNRRFAWKSNLATGIGNRIGKEK